MNPDDLAMKIAKVLSLGGVFLFGFVIAKDLTDQEWERGIELRKKMYLEREGEKSHD